MPSVAQKKGICLKMNYGSFIREQAIKNLLSSQAKIAETGNARGLVILSKFILKISHQFDNEILELGFEINNKNSEYPPDEGQ